MTAANREWRRRLDPQKREPGDPGPAEAGETAGNEDFGCPRQQAPPATDAMGSGSPNGFGD